MTSKGTQLIIFVLAVFFGCQASAHVNMSYYLNVDTLNHYAEVTLKATNIKGTETTLKLPVWAPGYYKIMDYPVNITDFRANNGAKALKTEKQGKCTWVIKHNDTLREMTVTYHVYCNEQSVASAQIESTRAFIPLNGILMYVDGEKSSPVSLSVSMPLCWKHITTGLKRLNDNTFIAPNFDRLYDSPLLLGNHELKAFTHEGHKYEMAIETPDGIDKCPLIEDMKKVISSTTKLMGDVPYDNYAFLMMKEGQGGLEHLNSQAIFTNGSYNFPDRAEYISFLSFMAHEYYHLYNVKSIRPIELEPFNYDGEIYSHCLWVSEGLTVYYEHKILQMAGIISEKERMHLLSEYIRNIETHEGQKHQSLRQFSYDIFLNFMNWGEHGLKTTVSYYEKGPVIGLLLDIDIQRATKGKKSLDDVMRLLYNRFYKEKQRGFTEEELWQSITEIAGKPLDDIRKLVDTTAPIDYDSYLKYIGYELSKDYELMKIKIND